MTAKLASLLDLKDIPEETFDEPTADTLVPMLNELSTSAKINSALEEVTGLNQHDAEMDQIAAMALKSYKDLVNLGMSCSEQNAGKVFEVSGQMLKIALEARDAKVARKLKTVDLMLKKEKLENDVSKKSSPLDEDMTSSALDRNDILQMLKDRATTVESVSVEENADKQINTDIESKE